ncbi:hypothetical protein LTR37_016772 [Vermiconidia calcicola]|uniref:Uncharacterized protein n=1 Tax=Vermiconidia calcicola TaxID=1690605 RepID=A0ACC3MLZ2_9PEZI|nr:hypothetical protein LTR37_016772 [Vermiconidia calcicola]
MLADRVKKSAGDGILLLPDEDDNKSILLALRKLWSGEPYQRLNTSKREIRLLKLLPAESNDDSPIQCQISVHRLDLDVKYDALSYCWGDPSNPPIIYLNDRRLPVTRNLYEALQSLRERHVVPGWLWVNAICINQASIPERNYQVPLMNDIYSKAEQVHIWLGPEAEGIRHAMQRLSDNTRGKVRGHALLGDDMDRLFGGLQQLLGRPWWRRVWVVQEAVLAASPVVHCGSIQMPFSDITKGISTLESVSTVDSYPALDHSMATYPSVWNSLFNAWRVFDQINSQTSRMIVDNDDVEVVGNLNFCDATNPRDQVYGVLGLLSPSLAQTITPYYAKTVEEVYEDFTTKLVSFSKALAILRLCGRNPDTPDLPSWVPDYRHLSHRGYWAHQAGRDTAHDAGRRRAGELGVSAIFVDEVVAIERSPPAAKLYEMLDGDDARRLHILIQSWRSDKLPYFNMLREETGPSRIQLARFVDEEPLILEEYAGAADDAQRLLSRFRSWTLQVTDALIAGAQKDRRLSLLRETENEGLFVTKTGRVGLAYVLPQLGDSVAILAGCPYAMILRKVLCQNMQESYKIVTPSYCDGMMRGEMVPDNGKFWSSQLEKAEVFKRITLA